MKPLMTVSTGKLEQMSLEELAGVYSRLNDGKIPEFTSKEDAVRVVLELLAERQNAAKLEDRPNERRRKPFRKTPKVSQTVPNEGTKLHVLYKLLLGGATIDEVMMANSWKYREARKCILHMNSNFGWGLRQTESGHVFLIGNQV